MTTTTHHRPSGSPAPWVIGLAVAVVTALVVTLAVIDRSPPAEVTSAEAPVAATPVHDGWSNTAPPEARPAAVWQSDGVAWGNQAPEIVQQYQSAGVADSTDRIAWGEQVPEVVRRYQTESVAWGDQVPEIVQQYQTQTP